jgi:hypothetical protein
MLALLRTCAKVAYLSSRRQAAVSLGILAVLAVAARLDFAVLYAMLLWVLLSQGLALRVKESKEGWRHLLLSMAGYDWKFPGYLYVFVTVLALLAGVSGMGLNWIWQQQGWLGQPASGGVLFGITAGVLFFYQCLLLVSEVVAYENLIMMQKVSLFVLVIAAKAVMDWKPVALLMAMPWVVGLMAVCSLGPVCLAATYLFRRRPQAF